MTSEKHVQEMESAHPQLRVVRDSLMEAIQALIDTYEAGKKLLLCGNGGSAADADHFAAELLKGFAMPRRLRSSERDRLTAEVAENLQNALPAIPLSGFSAFNSAFLNDCDARFAFGQLVWGLGSPGDALVGLSTSGASVNVIRAFEVARAKEMKTIALTGEGGGALAEIADVCISVPSTGTHRVQEFHLPVYHTICLCLEEHFFG
ncbi:MAG: SIS domain-containing protein [Opitutales bacterium]|nr:SIS domain-containing protein [Opitutales bacterium]